MAVMREGEHTDATLGRTARISAEHLPCLRLLPEHQLCARLHSDMLYLVDRTNTNRTNTFSTGRLRARGTG